MTTFDTHSLQGYSTIVSVAGTNPTLMITVQTGEGARFAVGQNVTIWPPFTLAVLTNSTIGRITGIVGDVLSVTTAQEGSSNIVVAALQQIANTITPKVFTDIETAIPAAAPTALQSNLTISDYTQMLFRQRLVVGSKSIILGINASLIGV